MGDRAGEGTTLNGIGGVYANQGRYAEALEAYEQALAIGREVGDRAGEGTTLNNIGVVYDDQGRYAEALEATSRRWRSARGRRPGRRGTTLNSIGGVYATRGAMLRRWRPTSRRWRSGARWATGPARVRR